MKESEVIEALKWYHELGFVLRDKVFLKPEELVRACRTISFKHKELIQSALEEMVIEDVQKLNASGLEEGRISNSILDRVWSDHKPNERESLRELFVKFGLAVKRDNHLVFPCLIPTMGPLETYFNCSRFEMPIVVGPLGFTARLVQHLINTLVEGQQTKQMRYQIYGDGMVIATTNGMRIRVMMMMRDSTHTSAATVEAIEVRSMVGQRKHGDSEEG